MAMSMSHNPRNIQYPISNVRICRDTAHFEGRICIKGKATINRETIPGRPSFIHYVPSVVNRSAVMDLHRSRYLSMTHYGMYMVGAQSLPR